MALPTQDLGPPPEPKDPRFLQWLALLWAYVKASATGTTGVSEGGTGLTSVAQGDLIYGSATDTYSLLNKNTTATRYLSNTGTSNNPAWAQVALTTGVSGTLPVANGGTGVTALGALTKTDDTNVTLTLGGSPTTALVNAASITVGWAGTLSVGRIDPGVFGFAARRG